MSQGAKWLLVLLLFLKTHIAYLLVTITSLTGSSVTTVLPFGVLDRSRIQGIVQWEILLAFLLLIAFSIRLLRERSRPE